MSSLKLHIYISILLICFSSFLIAQTYKIVGTGQTKFYNANSEIKAPASGEEFYGQDASYPANEPSYKDNNDGTITDLNTGLMWQKYMGDKITYAEAFVKADSLRLGGFTDWRVPTIKELYSLILFTGQVNGATAIKKFIDTNYFDQPIGNTAIGEREIDAQVWSSTQYKGLTMNGDSTVFGVNFIDGRIKGYPEYQPGSNNSIPRTMYFRMVRGNTYYGKNNFVDNNDGTISDLATGLMWQKSDDGIARDWQTALSYSENLSLAGYSDWRLPSAKELQSIVDYSRSPQTTNSAAINPVFNTTSIVDPNGKSGQYPYFWSATSHLDGINPYSAAVYVAFGEAQGKMNGMVMDVHGAGAQRSDPKSGQASDFPQYFGPQGDVRYVFNYVRCVRTANTATTLGEKRTLPDSYLIKQNYPNPFNPETVISYQLPVNSRVQIKIYDVVGREVETLIDEFKNPGIYYSTFSTLHSSLSSGIYFYRIVAGNYSKTMKMICLK